MNLKRKVYYDIIKRNWYRPAKILNVFLSVIFSGAKKWVAGPISLDIEPTLACNLDCVMCHRKELAKKRERMTMDFKTFKKIIDQIPTLMKVTIQGMGEPFLAKDLFAMARYARQKGLFVATVTNGNAFNEEKIAQTVACGIDRVYVSIDSLDEEKYRTYRVGGNLAMVKRNVCLLVKKRNAVKSEMMIGIWMLLFENNLDQLIPMIKFAKLSGVDELVVNTEITYRGKEHWKNKIASMDSRASEKTMAALNEAINFAKKEDVSFRVISGIGAMKPTAKSRCQWPWKALYVTSEGDISPCCVIADPQMVNFGNVIENGFAKIWRGEKYRSLRKKLIEGKIPSYCKGCYKK